MFTTPINSTSIQQIHDRPLLKKVNLIPGFSLPVHSFSREQGEMMKGANRKKIRNAATRIFHDPLRSFLELVVNGLDAVKPNDPVGQFGMGFLSILSFLDHQETRGSEILIETTYKEKKGTLYTYEMRFEKIDGEIWVTFKKREKIEEKRGTKITIRPLEGEFSEETLAKLNAFLWDLQFCQGSFEVKGQQPYTIGRGELLPVSVELSAQKLVVQDEGCGIPFSVAHSKLLIPSASTKVRQKCLTAEVKAPEFVKLKGKESGHSYFVISIHGPIIIKLPLPQPLYNSAREELDLHLELPAETPLTLARDEISFSGSGQQTRIYLQRVIDQLIKKVLEGSQEEEHLLAALYQGIQEWEKQSPSTAKEALTSFIQERIEQHLKEGDFFTIPLEHAEALRQIAPEEKLVAFPHHLLSSDFNCFEELLVSLQSPSTPLEESALNEKIIDCKRIIFIEEALLPKALNTESALICSFGLNHTLFAPRSLLDAAEKEATSSYSAEKHLAFNLTYTYSEEGKKIAPAQKKASAFRMHPKDTPLEYLADKRAVPISFKKIRSISILETLKSGPFSSDEGEAFTALWSDEVASWIRASNNHFFNKVFYYPHALFWTPKQLFKSLKSIEDRGEFRAEFKEMKTLQTFWERIILHHAGQSYYFASKEAMGEFEKILAGLKRKERLPIDSYLCDRRLFCTLSKEQESKLYFSWLYAQTSEHWPKNMPITEEILTSQLWGLTPRPGETRLKEFFEKFKGLEEIYDQKILPTLQKYPKEDTFPLGAVSKETEEIVGSFSDLRREFHSLEGKIAEIAIFRQALLESKGISSELKEEAKLFFMHLLSHYRSYLTIPDRAHASFYGSSSAVLIEPARDMPYEFSCSLKDALELLSHLNAFPELYRKLLVLFEKEMESYLNLEARANYLISRALPAYGIFNSTGFALLARLHALEFPEEWTQFLIRHVQNWEELKFFALLCSDNALFNLFQTTNLVENKLSLKSAFTYIISTYIRIETTPADLRMLLAMTWRYPTIQDVLGKEFRRSLPTISALLQRAAEQGHLLAVKTHFIDLPYQSALDKEERSFKARALLKAFQTHPEMEKWVASKEIEELLNYLLLQTGDEGSTVYNLAIQHSTGRLGTDASIIETTQNSADAICNFAKKLEKNDPSIVTYFKKRMQLQGWPEAEASLNNILYAVEMIKEERTYLALQIEDSIGMQSLKTLLFDFLIPDTSEKSKEAGNIGEMGNGSFQIYRDAEQVTLLTRLVEDPDKFYFVRILPIREGGEVVDLSIKICDVSSQFVNSAFLGTQIRILFKNENREEYAIEAEGLAVMSFIQRSMGMNFLQTTKNPIHLFLKDREGVCQHCTQFANPGTALDLKRFSPSSPAFQFLLLRHSQTKGAVLTAGFYFKDLETFLKEEKLLAPALAERFSRGWTLNIPSECYAPVQSRSRLRLFHREELQKLIVEWLYYRLIIEGENSPAAPFIPHFKSSSGSFFNVIPYVPERKEPLDGSSQGLSSFFVHHRPFFTEGFPFPSFYACIQNGYQQMVNMLQKERDLLDMKLAQPDLDEEKYQNITSLFRNNCKLIFQRWGTLLLEKIKKMRQLKTPQNVTFDKEITSFLHKLIFAWFSKKLANFCQSIPSLKGLKVKCPGMRTPFEEVAFKEGQEEVRRVMQSLEEKGLTPAQLKKIAASSLEVYCQLFYQLNHFQGDAPKIEFCYEAAKKLNASYTKQTNRISINLHQFRLSDLLEMCLSFREYECLQEGHPTEKLLLPSAGRAGSLNHEIEHARRGSDCFLSKELDAHGEGENIKKERVSFEAAATSYARYAHTQGLFKTWAQELQKLFPADQNKNLESAVESLRSIEKRYVAQTMEVFFPSQNKETF
jgi:hypothetical protein